jgi:hypothetical protein
MLYSSSMLALLIFCRSLAHASALFLPHWQATSFAPFPSWHILTHILLNSTSHLIQSIFHLCCHLLLHYAPYFSFLGPPPLSLPSSFALHLHIFSPLALFPFFPYTLPIFPLPAYHLCNPLLSSSFFLHILLCLLFVPILPFFSSPNLLFKLSDLCTPLLQYY